MLGKARLYESKMEPRGKKSTLDRALMWWETGLFKMLTPGA